MKCDSQLQYNLEIASRVSRAFDNGNKSRERFVHVTLIVTIVTGDNMLHKTMCIINARLNLA